MAAMRSTVARFCGMALSTARSDANRAGERSVYGTAKGPRFSSRGGAAAGLTRTPAAEPGLLVDSFDCTRFNEALMRNDFTPGDGKTAAVARPPQNRERRNPWPLGRFMRLLDSELGLNANL